MFLKITSLTMNNFIPFEVMTASTEFDTLFQLANRSPGIGNNHAMYVWKASRKHFFRGCDYTQIFPLAVNLYLKACSPEEKSTLLTKKYFLRIRMFYEDKECNVSFITVQNLILNGFKDPKYRDLMSSCPEDMIPADIEMGPIWHFVGINRWMFEMGRIELGATGLIHIQDPDAGVFPSVTCIMGITLLGRDAYPGETTEEKIKEMEEIEGIFILRK